MNWTVPEGKGAPEAWTIVAVKVTELLSSEGLREETTVVVVLALLMTWLALPVLVL